MWEKTPWGTSTLAEGQGTPEDWTSARQPATEHSVNPHAAAGSHTLSSNSLVTTFAVSSGSLSKPPSQQKRGDEKPRPGRAVACCAYQYESRNPPTCGGGRGLLSGRLPLAGLEVALLGYCASASGSTGTSAIWLYIAVTLPCSPRSPRTAPCPLRFRNKNHSRPRAVKTVHDKVSTIEVNLRKKSLSLPADILTGGLSDMGPDTCTKGRLHHRGSKLDLRSYLRSKLKTVASFEFRAGLEIEITVSSFKTPKIGSSESRSEISNHRRQIKISLILNIDLSKIDESEIQNHELALVQHFYIGTKIKLDSGSELGSFDLRSGAMLMQLALRATYILSQNNTPTRLLKLNSKGAAVAERLARSPPTKANRIQSPARPPDFRMWESCQTMPLVSGFSRGYPVSPALSFRRCSIFTSVTLIGSQDRTSVMARCMGHFISEVVHALGFPRASLSRVYREFIGLDKATASRDNCRGVSMSRVVVSQLRWEQRIDRPQCSRSFDNSTTIWEQL
ncbi:hypothetical protein PR048_015501 [Dryococelus australis]|uniref:Uncharacterized protein n=1 Tax=Dryococelus australis TaxID=614101 RepID=A0ABQ9HH29_9NEOP|nr:hypothetical protein PR048_015501 [Dryococelus australis]